ncbi:MAG: YeiH family protein [Halofilum sp. (in: g-proteobacteria)]
MSSTVASAERGLAQLRGLWPGLLTAVTIAMAAVFVSDHYGGPTLLYALLLGIAFNFLAAEPRTAPGIEFSARQVLRVGVALLGARIGLEQIGGLGADVIGLVIGTVVATLVFGRLMAAILGLSARQGVLTGGAVGICGASAALAIAAVLPRDAHAERDTLFAIVGVTTLGTLTMIFYPVIVAAIDLDGPSAGIFLGATIHDVAQVVGAGYMVSGAAGDTATVTKLLRVAMLAPMVLVIAMLFRRANGQSAVYLPWWRRLQLPLFLLAFMVIAGLNSLGLLSAAVAGAATEASRWCLICAIAAIGMKTDLRELARVGWPAVALMVAETVFMAVVVLGFVVVWQ